MIYDKDAAVYPSTAGGVAAAILFGYLNAVIFTPKTKK